MMLTPPTHVTDLPEGRLPADWLRPDGVVVHSLTAHALCAMERHKWIESEKAGRDIGFEQALTDWIIKHRSNWRRNRQAAVN